MESYLSNKKKSQQDGFTLLEILVALAIFALVSLACYRQIDTSFRASERIEQKYLALWIAESKLDEMLIKRQWPFVGEIRSDYESSDLQWAVKTTVSETEIKGLRRVEVSIYKDRNDLDHAILTLIRYVGEN